MLQYFTYIETIKKMIFSFLKKIFYDFKESSNKDKYLFSPVKILNKNEVLNQINLSHYYDREPKIYFEAVAEESNDVE